MTRPSGANWRDVRALYGREVRSALRERSVVVNSILLPILLYPLLLWVEITALVFVTGLSESAPSRVVIVDPPAAHAALIDSLETNPGIESAAAEPGLDRLRDELGLGDLDAIVAFAPPTAPSGTLEDNFAVHVHYDRSVDRSRRALQRVRSVVDGYRGAWIADQASMLGLTEAALSSFEIEQRNVSTDEALGAAILGLMLPLFLVIAVALGCLVPAVDTTAGERERGTWETLMVTQASRASVVLSKYLYVASFGAAAGVLNVTAMTLALGPVMAPLQGLDGGSGAAFTVSLSPTSVLVMLTAAALLALFFAAAMMLLASFARSFKDGQALVTPVFYLALLPLLLGQQSDRSLSNALAAVPVANIAMAVRDAINGVFVWPALALTVLVTLALVLACIALARYVLGFEDFLLGTHGGSLWRFMQNRFAGGAA
ncbi:MAG: ABC transporter permease [Gemmatimonadota bacterium]